MKKIENKEIVQKKEKGKKLSIWKNNIKDILSKKLSSQSFNLLELILLVVVAFVFGVFISEAFIYNNDSSSKLSNKKSVGEIETVYNSIITEYYKDLDKEKLKESAINGMLSYLQDKYSDYYDLQTTEEFNETTDGIYYGLGLKITKNSNDDTIISEVFENTPASKAELLVGDKIVKVDEKDVSDYSLTDIVSLIKGKENQKVILTVKRDSEVLIKTLITSKIDIPSVSSKVIEVENKKIGYIYISIFALNTDEQFIESLKKLEKNGIDSLIIDVRNNIGGHLSSVTNILNLFFDKDEVIYQINKKNIITKIYGANNVNKNYKVVFLINNASASGSEILASAFKETKGSELIGITTYGKGTVQQVIDLEDGTMLKITTETWLTSTGKEINEVGVTPTIEIKLDDNYSLNPTEENDNQLQKAIEILKNK